MSPDSSHPIPGEGAGPTANGHSHITACIQMAPFNANPGTSRQRPTGGAHTVEGRCLQEDDLLEGINPLLGAHSSIWAPYPVFPQSALGARGNHSLVAGYGQQGQRLILEMSPGLLLQYP